MRAPRRYSNSPRWDDTPHRPNTPAENAARAEQVKAGQLDFILQSLAAGKITRADAETLAAPFGIVLP